jgi:hypothetical protein
MSFNNNLYRDLVILYCPEKVGSTSIVSSIRISTSDKFMVFHTHENKIADVVNLNCVINVSDLVLNGTILNPATNQYRKIYIIDIFRTPIEKKISSFFQKISEIHFNNSESNITSYPIDKIFKRFNDIFVHLDDYDYYNDYYNICYGCNKIEKFDFDKKYILQQIGNVSYIKLRLQDSELWGDILTKILGVKIYMIHDYQTENKSIGQLYKKFKNDYKLPYNYYKLLEKDISLDIYMEPHEKTKYLKNWFEKITKEHVPFTKFEYDFYIKISTENKFYCANSSNLHYNDDGCICLDCEEKRKIVKYNLINKIPQNIYLRHFFDEKYDNNIYIKLFPSNNPNESFDLNINLINS